MKMIEVRLEDGKSFTFTLGEALMVYELLKPVAEGLRESYERGEIFQDVAKRVTEERNNGIRS